MKTFVFDIGETLVRDDRYWGSWADWLGTPRHTLSALVGAVTAQGLDNSEALKLVKPGIDIPAEYAAREAAGRGEYLDESDLYEDVRPALAGLRRLGMRVVVAGNQTVRAGELLRGLDLPADLVVTSEEWGAPSRRRSSSRRCWRHRVPLHATPCTSATTPRTTRSPPPLPDSAPRTSAGAPGDTSGSGTTVYTRRPTG